MMTPIYKLRTEKHEVPYYCSVDIVIVFFFAE